MYLSLARMHSPEEINEITWRYRDNGENSYNTRKPLIAKTKLNLNPDSTKMKILSCLMYNEVH